MTPFLFECKLWKGREPRAQMLHGEPFILWSIGILQELGARNDRRLHMTIKGCCDSQQHDPLGSMFEVVFGMLHGYGMCTLALNYALRMLHKGQGNAQCMYSIV